MKEDCTTIMGVESISGDFNSVFEFTTDGKYL
jgi:hypothetical protein